MSKLRLVAFTVLLSFCSFTYVHAQSTSCADAAQKEDKTIVQTCPTADAQSILPSESFLKTCVEKFMNAVSISAIMQEPITVEAEKKKCPKSFDDAQLEI